MKLSNPGYRRKEKCFWKIHHSALPYESERHTDTEIEWKKDREGQTKRDSDREREEEKGIQVNFGRIYIFVTLKYTEEIDVRKFIHWEDN